MAHREDIRAYLEGLEIKGFATDWGCGAKPVKNYLKSYDKMITIDNNKLCNPDMVCDITKDIVLPQESDHAFCMEVLEHVVSPQQVIDNIHTNLKPGGTLHLSVPFMYPVHGDQDYWRFTNQGLEYLTRDFSECEIWEITDGYLMEAIK